MIRASRRRFVAPVALVSVLSLSLLSCGREVTGPTGGAGSHIAQLAFAPHLTGPASVIEGAGAVVPYTRVRVILRRIDDTELLSQVVDFPANVDEVPLTLEVPLPPSTTASGLPLRLLLRYIDAADDTVFAGGPVDVRAIPVGAGSGPQLVDVPLLWVGPGSSIAAAVDLTPAVGNAEWGTTTALSAIVRDGGGLPLVGVPVVYWTPDPTLASIAGGTVTWLSARGNARIVASLPSGLIADTATFTVSPPATQLVPAAGDGQRAAVTSALPMPITVRAIAADAGPVAGVPVTFAVATGGGALGTLTATTDANGEASTSWTLGASLGAQTVTASAAGLASATFNATADPGPATQLVITTAPTALSAGTAGVIVVEARDVFGNRATGFAGDLTFSITSGPTGSALLGTTTRAAVGGTATFDDLRIFRAGTYTLSVTANGLTGADIVDIVNSPGPLAGVVGVSGSGQSALVGATLPLPLVARAVDAFGNGVPGTITFTVRSGGGSLAPATVTTDATGLAQTTWTLGSFEGFQEVDVSVGGFPPSPQFFASGFLPQLFLFAGSGQSGELGSTLPVPIRVRALSPSLAPVSGFRLTFDTGDPTVNGSASPASVLTDVDGFASTNWTLGGFAGTQRMTVTFPGQTTPLSITAEGFFIILLRDPGVAAIGPPIQ